MAKSGNMGKVREHQRRDERPIGPKDPGHKMTEKGGPQGHRGGGGANSGMKRGY